MDEVDERTEEELRDNGCKSVRTGLIALLSSVFSAAVGVQSDKNRQRDFTGGNYRHFIVAGVVFTIVFVLTIVFVVRMVLNQAGS